MSTTDNQTEAPHPDDRRDADDLVYRPAVAADSRFIASMIELSSDGIASLEWQEESERTSGLSALDIGARQYASAEGDYSYRNCLIADAGAPAGMILSFSITAENLSADAKPPPYTADDIYAPYKYLEAVDSWYICGVAVVPEYRKLGIGKRLIELSIEQGAQRGFANTSLIAMAAKTTLIAFYESLGFVVTRRAPIVEHPGIRASGDAVLMETRPR